MRVYNDREHQAYGWYVHINQYRGVDGVHALYRGDSDAQVMYRGIFKNYDELECELESYYDYFMEEADEEEQKNFPDLESYIQAFPEIVSDAVYRSFCEYATEKTNKGNIKKIKLMKAIGRNEEENLILELSKQLSPCDDNVRDIAPCMVQQDYDAHHANFCTISDTIGDYQVLRIFDVEIEPIDPMDKANEEEQNKYDEAIEKDGYYDSVFEEVCERLYYEEGDAFHEFEIGEVAQEWINMKTGNIIRLGRVYDENPEKCDFDAPYEIISNENPNNDKMFVRGCPSARQEHFSSTFFRDSGTHYMDLNIHPLLKERGYKEIDCSDYYFHCGEEEQKTEDALLYESIKDSVNMSEMLSQFVKGGKWERRIKSWNKDMLNIYSKLSDEYKENFDIAANIMLRCKYEIPDVGMYVDLFEAMCETNKDIHNRFYVCPTDFKDMHDRIIQQYAKMKDKIKQIKELEEAMKENKYYQGLVDRYGDIRLSDEEHNITIMLCPSIDAMQEEGKHMHHCVFRMGYYKRNKNCLIMFVRDYNDNSKRISTMELSLYNFSIVQNRGVNNVVPEFDELARQLVRNNKHLFIEAKNRELNEVSIAAEAQAMPLAA